MSKRAGEFVTVEELLERSASTRRAGSCSRARTTRTVDLDVELARQQSSENPVYYVQYAHARIASLLDRIGEDDGSRRHRAAGVGRRASRCTRPSACW